MSEEKYLVFVGIEGAVSAALLLQGYSRCYQEAPLNLVYFVSLAVLSYLQSANLSVQACLSEYLSNDFFSFFMLIRNKKEVCRWQNEFQLAITTNKNLSNK